MKTHQRVTSKFPTENWRPPDPEKRSPAALPGANGAGSNESGGRTSSNTNSSSKSPVRSTPWIKLADATEEMLDAYIRQASYDEEGSL